jgi:hypothetical protein
MATSLLSSELLDRYSEDVLITRLTKFASLIEKAPDSQVAQATPVGKSVARYRELSTEKTTDAVRRKERQQELIKALDLL